MACAGVYDLVALAPTLTARGLSSSLVIALAGGDLVKASPTELVQRQTHATRRAAALATSPRASETDGGGSLPSVVLIHGTADRTVGWEQSRDFAASLRLAGAAVSETYFEGKSHTDPILEDRVHPDGDDPLMAELLRLVLGKTAAHTDDGAHSPSRRAGWPAWIPAGPCLRAARAVNPF